MSQRLHFYGLFLRRHSPRLEVPRLYFNNDVQINHYYKYSLLTIFHSACQFVACSIVHFLVDFEMTVLCQEV